MEDMSAVLANRDNWQDMAHKDGASNENNINDILQQYLDEKYANQFIVSARPRIDYPNNDGHIRLDGKIVHIETGRFIFFEHKKQNDRGNAHERAYKYHARGDISFYIRAKYGISYYPVMTIFAGGMATANKYIREMKVLYATVPGSYLMFNGDVKMLTDYFDREIYPRLTNDAVNDYDYETVKQREDKLISEYQASQTELSIEPSTKPLTKTSIENASHSIIVDLANTDEIRKIIADAGPDGILTREIINILKKSPSKAIQKLQRDKEIYKVSGKTRDATWAITN
jgi:hypothetical protein